MKTRQDMINLVEETREYYRTNPFGYDTELGRCTYDGPCAIGRLLPPQLRSDLQASGLGTWYHARCHDSPAARQAMVLLDDWNNDFLCDLQYTHDSAALAANDPEIPRHEALAAFSRGLDRLLRDINAGRYDQ